MEILNGEVQLNETTKNAMGGTELLGYELQKRVPQDLLKEFQIVSSRVRDLADDKIRIFWAHDLPGDPESEFLKIPLERDQFHLFVFVSNWQMQAYINFYQIPWSRCIVLKNAITPIPEHEKPDHKEKLNLIYFSTPHRGLNILIPVFDKLAKKYGHIELDVFSSFKLYGWEERDKQYENLFQICRGHDQINFMGSVDNTTIRSALTQSHILAYPSTWMETSCLVLMEAMSAGLTCVHSNLAALPETAGYYTIMYQFNENPEDHANILYHMLDHTIQNYDNPQLTAYRKLSKNSTDIHFGWDTRIREWVDVLTSLKNKVTDRSLPKGEVYTFKT